MDRRGDAGRAAEKQMAFYLAEYFRRVSNVRVFHNVSFLGEAGIRHQIDHLVLHLHGLCIVESKSVSTEVVVNERGEWSRRWNGQLQGMASPVEQAKRQAIALRHFLNDRSTELSAKGKRDGFNKTPIETFVAISDQGRWSPEGRQSRAQLPVYKADLIPERIKGEIDRHEKASGLFARLDDGYGEFRFKPQTFDRLAHFIETLSMVQEAGKSNPESQDLASQRPHGPKSWSAPGESRSKPATVPEEEIFTCEKCGGTQGRPTPGKYGAYFVCTTCSTNNGAPRRCTSCKSDTRTTIVDDSLRTQCKTCNWTLVRTSKRLNTESRHASESV